MKLNIPVRQWANFVGENAQIVRKLFEMAHSQTACIIFFDEVDDINGA